MKVRRIISKHEEEKKQKRTIKIVGLILIFVMFGSVFGIIINSFGQNRADTNLEYNGYEFINKEGLWYSSVNNVDFAFRYHPSQTTSEAVGLKLLNNYNRKPLYIYSEDSNSEAEIYRNLQQIAERVQPACLNKEKCSGDYPIKTCSENFIIIEISEQNEITQQENCVYLRGQTEELLKLSDEFLFKIIGIK